MKSTGSENTWDNYHKNETIHKVIDLYRVSLISPKQKTYSSTKPARKVAHSILNDNTKVFTYFTFFQKNCFFHNFLGMIASFNKAMSFSVNGVTDRSRIYFIRGVSIRKSSRGN